MLAFPPSETMFRAQSLFLYLHVQLVLIGEHILIGVCKGTPSSPSCEWAGGRLCLSWDRSGRSGPDGSLPAAGKNFHTWGSVFKGGRPGCAGHTATVLMPIETWACLGHKPRQSCRCHTFQAGPVIFPWLRVLQLLLKTGLNGPLQSNESHRPLNSHLHSSASPVLVTLSL